jgi:hypothetical protein
VRNRIRGGHRLIAVPKLLPLLPIRTAANFLFCYLFVILDPSLSRDTVCSPTTESLGDFALNWLCRRTCGQCG